MVQCASSNRMWKRVFMWKFRCECECELWKPLHQHNIRNVVNDLNNPSVFFFFSSFIFCFSYTIFFPKRKCTQLHTTPPDIIHRAKTETKTICIKRNCVFVCVNYHLLRSISSFSISHIPFPTCLKYFELLYTNLIFRFYQTPKWAPRDKLNWK